MELNDAVTRTFTKRGRIAKELPNHRVLVRWEDGSESEESIRDMNYGDPKPLCQVMAHAEFSARA
jgi:hypothetical protein